MSETVQQLLGDGSALAYVALFFGIMLENAGIPLPGETALLIAGYLSCESGKHVLHLWLVIPIAFLGAVIGDNLGFLLGRKLARPRLAAGKRFLFLTPERFLKAEVYFAKYGAATVFFGRWVALLRIAAGPAAGAAGMPWPRFLVANAAGAALWATAIGIIGYLAGPAWEALQRWLGRGAWALAGAVVLAFVAWKVIGWLRKTPTVVRTMTTETVREIISEVEASEHAQPAGAVDETGKTKTHP
ncbi:MAG TPA: DedA family protein [Gemmataceae bacterium]|jgi:membrane-associated protein|nr:DedA family protein [Gemmataceae bacterium]